MGKQHITNAVQSLVTEKMPRVPCSCTHSTYLIQAHTDTYLDDPQSTG